MNQAAKMLADHELERIRPEEGCSPVSYNVHSSPSLS